MIYIMPKTKKGTEKAIAKSVTITARHQRFIEARSLNLSKFIKKKLDEEIEEQKWADEN